MSSQRPAGKSNENQTVSDETILKIAKEISIKFIEVGRVVPSTFDESFRNIYNSIESTVRKK
ncbi:MULTISPECIES: hypothetical protein [Desulfosediminicola]|uniref:hypothetical protein n=1 Tax=Desulfosediminicola TaxID=2886823 RepID=UPI0010AD608D|nr:hypothetical protein [Desulfosediminicola ganghwensis]